MPADEVNLVKVFSATKARDRENLGAKITEWLAQRRDVHVVNTIVAMSSDLKFHCLSIVMLCCEAELPFLGP